MTAGLIVLLALCFVTFFNLGLGYHSQLATYSLLPDIARETGPEGFRRYQEAYRHRLPLIAFSPVTVIMALSVAFLFLHPEGSGLLWRALVLVLNLTVAALSVALAGPAHRRVASAGAVSDKDGKALLHWNGLRVDGLIVSAVTVVYLLVRAIS